MGNKLRKTREQIEKEYPLAVRRFEFEAQYAEMYGHAPTEEEVDHAAETLRNWIFENNPNYFKEALQHAKESLEK